MTNIIKSPSNILLVDFYDSFTFNIYSVLKKINFFDHTPRIKVVKWDDLFRSGRLREALLTQFDSVILGPGPGHPLEYRKVCWPLLSFIFNSTRIKVVGVCLGHQMLADYYGGRLNYLNSPLHGQSEVINRERIERYFNRSLSEKQNRVQFYNSLVVAPQIFSKRDIEAYIEKDQCLILRSSKFISYQFHPESVGTALSDTWFYLAFDILYNGIDGKQNKSQRHLRYKNPRQARGNVYL